MSSFLPAPRLGLVNPEGYIAFSCFHTSRLYLAGRYGLPQTPPSRSRNLGRVGWRGSKRQTACHLSLPHIMAKRVVRNRAPCASNDGTASLVNREIGVHCPQTRTLPGAGSVLHIHNFEALSAKNLKCAIFIGVFVNHDCAVSRLFLAGMRGDTRPLEATDTIRHVKSGPMAFTMEDPNFFHAASLPSIARSISCSMNDSRSDTPAAIAGVTRKLG